MAYQANFSNKGGGPRIIFGTDANPKKFMSIGAYNSVNNIDTTGRPLLIKGLPDSSTAPDGADLRAILIDKNTGKLYIL